VREEGGGKREEGGERAPNNSLSQRERGPNNSLSHWERAGVRGNHARRCLRTNVEQPSP